MLPVAANVPLALCSVLIRRFIDSHTGRLAQASSSLTLTPTACAVTLLSGALVYLYRQLHRGTRVGVGNRISAIIRRSKHTIQRRANPSWFLRNINSCRRRCANAVLKIARPSATLNDSLTQIVTESGTLEGSSVSGTMSLPSFNSQNVEENLRLRLNPEDPLLENLYSNDSFDSDVSSHDLQMITTRTRRKRESAERNRSNQINPPHRPVTRNYYRRNYDNVDSCGDSKRKKSDDDSMGEDSDDLSIIDVIPKTKETSTSVSISSVRDNTSNEFRKRLRKRPGRKKHVEKVTRKTRSGRIYAYRL